MGYMIKLLYVNALMKDKSHEEHEERKLLYYAVVKNVEIISCIAIQVIKAITLRSSVLVND